MPTAILKFKLPEEDSEFDLACRAGDMNGRLWEFHNTLRGWNKYGHQFHNAGDAVNRIYEEFFTTFGDYLDG